MAMSPADKLMREQITLLMDEPFFGTLLLRLKRIEDPAVKTMGTDGETLWFAPEFVDQTPADELRGVLAHEVLHVANLHHLRRGARDHKRFNIAADAAINHILLTAGFKLPTPGIFGPDWAWAKDLSAEEIYDRMPQEDPDGGDGPPGQVMDSPKQGQAAQAEEEQEVKMAVKQAVLAQQMKGKGDMPGWMKNMVDQIMAPKIDWKDRLRKFFMAQVPSDYTWARPNRRFVHQGIYLPGHVKTGIGEGVIYVDTSGSCWSDRPQFWGEMKSIIEDLQPERVHVVQCDSAVGDIKSYDQGEPIDLTVIGGGGSDFRPAFEAVEKSVVQPVWAVVLSDCDIDFPAEKPSYPVLVVSTTKSEGPEWAETIFMPKE